MIKVRNYFSDLCFKVGDLILLSTSYIITVSLLTSSAVVLSFILGIIQQTTATLVCFCSREQNSVSNQSHRGQLHSLHSPADCYYHEQLAKLSDREQTWHKSQLHQTSLGPAVERIVNERRNHFRNQLWFPTRLSQSVENIFRERKAEHGSYNPVFPPVVPLSSPLSSHAAKKDYSQIIKLFFKEIMLQVAHGGLDHIHIP